MYFEHFHYQSEEMSLRDAASSFVTELFTCIKEGGGFAYTYMM